MDIQNTTFRIIPETIPVIKNRTDPVSFNKKVYKVLAGRNSIPYFEQGYLDNLTRIENLLIEIQDTDGNISQVNLPEDIHNGIIRYFQNSPNIKDATDCLGFIVEVLGGKRGDRFVDDGNFSYHGVDVISDSSSLVSGDIISMSDGTEEGWNQGKYHYALHIGNGIFISKLGIGGVLVFSDLDQLKNIYPKLLLIIKILLKKK